MLQNISHVSQFFFSRFAGGINNLFEFVCLFLSIFIWLDFGTTKDESRILCFCFIWYIEGPKGCWIGNKYFTHSEVEKGKKREKWNKQTFFLQSIFFWFLFPTKKILCHLHDNHSRIRAEEPTYHWRCLFTTLSLATGDWIALDIWWHRRGRKIKWKFRRQKFNHHKQ